MNDDLLRLSAELEGSGGRISDRMTRLRHDLKGPLNAISGFSVLLKEPSFGTLMPKQLHFVQQIEDAAVRILAIIEASKVDDVATPDPMPISVNSER